jgi:nicotinamide mononucleotide transporter
MVLKFCSVLFLFAFQSEILEYMAVACSIAYVLLAARANIWCWPFGFVSSLLYLFIFANVRLFSDALLQAFYAAMAIYGWFSWRHPSAGENRSMSITHLRWSRHVLIVGAGIAIAFPLGAFWELFEASLPYIDACTTSFSILATVMVARKILENWLYWIAIDLAGMGIYWYKDLFLTSLLFLAYAIIAVYGFFRWRAQLRSL